MRFEVETEVSVVGLYCTMMKNELDPLRYGRLGLGMTRRVVNARQVG